MSRAGPGAVRWGQPPLTFELQSDDADVLAQAAVVFKPWRPETSSDPSHVWRIDAGANGAGRVWHVGRPGDAEPRARDSIASAVRLVEFLAVQALFEDPAVCAAHGALVARDGRGVLLLGGGETGKSTLACALWRRGWALLGDDMAVLGLADGCAWAGPRRVSLRAPSRGLLGNGLWQRALATPAGEPTSEGCVFDPAELDGCERAGAVSLAALIFLGRPAAPGGALEPAHALLALLPYTNVARRMPTGEAIRCLLPLAETVPACDLERAPLETMAAAVEDLLDQPG